MNACKDMYNKAWEVWSWIKVQGGMEGYCLFRQRAVFFCASENVSSIYMCALPFKRKLRWIVRGSLNLTVHFLDLLSFPVLQRRMNFDASPGLF